LVIKFVSAAVAATVLAGVASAADVAPVYKAAPLATRPISDNWTGFYVGGNVGAAWSNTSADEASFTTTGVDFPGRQAVGQFPNFNVGDTAFAGGGQIGYNLQFAPNWVAGIETDFDFTGLDKTDARIFPATHFIGDGPIDANTELASQKLSWLGTVRGRLGYTILDNRLLVFATGGLAYGRVTDSVQTVGVPNGAGGSLVGANANAVRTGWTLGGGFEYAFSNAWSAKLEYLHYDLGSQILTLDFGTVPGDAGNTFSYKFKDAGNLVRVGVNYRF
jgi:outer membrane immunogenic protein